jgi:hypothetical protein
MIDLFAIDDPTADPSYRNIRSPRGEGAAVARANCDDLWRDFAPYASDHFCGEFRRQFHQRWFEMYVAVALLRSGLKIECPPGAAPDIRVQRSDGGVLWLEAIAPTGGSESNPDRGVQPIAAPGESSMAYYVPTEQVALRICGALREKAAKHMTYRNRGIISPEHQAIVAINVHGIPHAAYHAERLGLAATYGVGPQYVAIDRTTLEITESGFQHRAVLVRNSGSPVDAAPFLHSGFEHVSGALIAGTDAANCPYPPGYDFMLLPNPNAAPMYTERQLPVGREWRLGPLNTGGYQIIEVVEHSRRIHIVRLFYVTTHENARKILETGLLDRSRESTRDANTLACG